MSVRGGITSILAVFLLVLGLVFPVTASAEPAPEPSEDASQTGQIYGSVSDTAGNPVQGVTVAAVSAAGSAQTVSAGAAGRFELGALQPGDYRLRFAADNDEWQTVDSEPLEVAAGERVEYRATLTAVAPSESPATDEPDTETPGVPAVSPPGALPPELTQQQQPASETSEPSQTLVALSGEGRIFGQVTNESGDPVGGASITVYGSEETDWAEASAVSVADGSYAVENLPTGLYEILARDESGAYGQAVISEIVIIDDAEVEQDLVLPQGGSIVGQVTDAEGNPVVDAVVYSYAIDGAGYDWVEASTDANGDYELLGLTPGSYAVEVTAPGQPLVPGQRWDVEVQPNQATTVDFTLQFGGTLRVRVFDPAGQPVEGAWVEAYGDDEDYAFYEGQTDESGTVELIGLPAGAFVVELSAPDLPYQRATFTDVVIEVGQVTQLEHTLSVGGTLSGQVRSEDGEPVVGASVVAFGTDVDDWGWAITDETGNYSLLGLRAGRYDVAVGGENSPYAPAQREGLLVTNGDTTTANFTLYLGGAVTGRVVDPDGNPVRGFYVELQQFSDNWLDGRSVETSVRGEFSLVGLSAGDYLLVLTSSTANFENVVHGVITVTAGQTQDVVVTVQPAGEIAGRVVDTSGDPVPGVSVVAFGDEDTVWDYQDARTNANGEYLLTGLTAGSYEVSLDSYPIADFVAEPVFAVVERGARTSGVDLIALRAASLFGSLLPGVDADGYESFVTLVDPDTCEYLDGGYVESDGSFEISYVLPGRYLVGFNTDWNYTQFAPQFYGANGAADCLAASPVELAEGEALDLGVTNQIIGGVVTGNLVDADGNPIAPDSVLVFDQEDGLVARYGDVAENGEFSVPGLATGDFYLIFEFEPDYDQWLFDDEADEFTRTDGITPGWYYYSVRSGEAIAINEDQLASRLAVTVGEQTSVGEVTLVQSEDTDDEWLWTDIRLPASAWPGQTIDIYIGEEFAGELIELVLGDSDGYLGQFRVDDAGYVRATIPLSTPLGRHFLFVLLYGDVIGADSINIVARPSDGVTPGGGSNGGNGDIARPIAVVDPSDLPGTGGDRLGVLLAGLLMTLVGGLVFAGRSKLAAAAGLTPNRD